MARTPNLVVEPAASAKQYLVAISLLQPILHRALKALQRPVQTRSQNDMLSVPRPLSDASKAACAPGSALGSSSPMALAHLAAITVQTIQLLGKQLPHVSGPQFKIRKLKNSLKSEKFLC
jgi:hypothetical protein